MAIYNESYFNDQYINSLLENVNITPEQINRLCKFSINENFDYSVIFESSVDKSLQKLSPSLKQDIGKTGKEIAAVVKADGINANSKKKISKIISDFFDAEAEKISFKQIIDSNGELQKCERSKVKKAFIIFGKVLIASALANVVFSILFGMVIGNVIGSIVVAPIVEEYGKLTAEKAGCNKEYFIIFNAFEFSEYMAIGISKGIPGMFGSRLAAIGLHAVNTAIHKALNDPKIQEKLKLTGEDGKEKATLISYIATVIIHGCWNTAAVFAH